MRHRAQLARTYAQIARKPGSTQRGSRIARGPEVGLAAGRPGTIHFGGPRVAKGDGENRRKVIASNRKARYEYEILDTFEAGMVLLGPEVKSLRAGKASLGDAYAEIRRGEVYLLNAHIGAYEQAGRANAPPRRERKLLLHRHEIARLVGRVVERGLTLIPLQLYFKDGRAKVELALARGKRRYDKRQAIRKRENERDLKRIMRGRGRSRP